MRAPDHRMHRDNVISPLALAVVLTGAIIAAFIPFAIVLTELRVGSERYVPAMLAAVTVFFLLFPLAVRFLTPRPRHARDRRGP
jgi:hypothetical protein